MQEMEARVSENKVVCKSCYGYTFSVMINMYMTRDEAFHINQI